MNAHERQLRFARRLDRLVRRTRRRTAAYGAARTAVVAGGSVLAAAWAMGAGPAPEGVVAWGLTLSVLAVIGVVVRAWLLVPLAGLGSPRKVADRLERRGRFGNILVAAEEAVRQPERWKAEDPVDRELRARLWRRANDLLDATGPEAVVPRQRPGLWFTGAALVLVLSLGYLITAPDQFGLGLVRLVTPWPETRVLATGGLYGEPGEEFVVAGEGLRLAAVDFAGGVGQAVCEIRTGSGLWQPLETASDPVYPDRPGRPAPYRRWTAEVADVREDIHWRFRRGDLVSRSRMVAVRHHPLVTRLAARVEPPAYTRVPAQDLPRLPSRFEVPVGSILRLAGTTSHPVGQARVVTTAGDTLTAAVDSTGLRVDLAVDYSFSFVLEIADRWGLANRNPLRYEVAATPDEAPVVELRRPDDDGILPLAGEVVLEVAAGDDFGLDEIRLLVRTLSARDQGASEAWQGGAFWPGEPGAWRRWPVPPGELAVKHERLDDGGSVLRTRFRLEVRAGELDLVPGDVLEIVAEAVDNKRPRPAGVGRSAPLRLTLPSAADVLDLQAEATREHQSDLEEARRRGGELEQDLDRLTRELMKNPLPDWARQQEMEKAIERQKGLQEELSRVAAELQEELDKLARGQLTTEQQLEKADQVSELLSQEGSERLQDLLARLEEGSTQVSPDEVARVMDEVARNQKDMARRLDAALAMLQRMEREQELEGLTALIEQMMRKQQELAELSREMTEEGDRQEGESQEGESQEGESQEGESPGGDPAEGGENEGQEKADPEELARRQEALARELEQLQEKLADALEKMKEQNEERDAPQHEKDLAESLEEALERMKEQQSSDKMDQASESLEQMDPEMAQQMQEQALRDLGSLYNVMLQTQQAMQMAMQQQQVSSLRGLAADLLAVSTRQEEIVARIPPRLRDLRTLELTRSQHRVQKASVVVRDNLAELLDESPTRILRLLEKLDGLIEEMGAGLNAMEENRAQVARRHARESLAASNNIVIGLLTEAQMSGGGGGGGSSQPSPSEQLQEMIRKQAELNGVTEELRQMLADRGMTQESRSQMQRLGQEQAELADRMGRLAEEQGSGQGGEGGSGGQEAGPDGEGQGPEMTPERVRPENERLLGDLSQLGRDMETVGEDIDDGLIGEETLRRQERILSRMLDARNSVRERDYSNRRESRTAGRLYGDQAGREGVLDPEDPAALRRFQPIEKAPLEYRDLVRRYFSALDSLRLEDLEDVGPVPDPRTERP